MNIFDCFFGESIGSLRMFFVYFGILGIEEVFLLRMDLVNYELFSNYNGNDFLVL